VHTGLVAQSVQQRSAGGQRELDESPTVEEIKAAVEEVG